MTNSSNKSPKLRFPGFTEPWEEKPLNATTEYTTSNLTLEDIETDAKYSLYDANSIVGKTNKNIQDTSYITIIKDGAGVGRVRLCPKKTAFIGTLGAIKSNNNMLFMHSLLQVFNFSKYIVGSTIPHLYYSDYSKAIIAIPKISEQEKIGNFFSKLDALITLHQRKLDHLQEQKKGLLQKMFPRNGQTVPEIRFPGFTEPWEERRLGDIGTVAMNRRVFKNQTSRVGPIPFFKIGTFGGVPDAFISVELFEEYKSLYPYPNVGDLLISASGSIGKIVEYKGENAYYQDSNIVWLNHNEKLENSFLKQFYAIVKWSGIEGSTIKRLYNKNILDTLIIYPTKKEQERIGDFFSKLDSLITLHQHKLDHLQEQKKALLQQMFV